MAGAVRGGELGAWLLMRVRPKACKKKCFSGGASLEDYIETALMIQYTTFMIFAFFLYKRIMLNFFSLPIFNSHCRSRGIEAGLVVSSVAGVGLAGTVIAIGIPASLAWLAIQKLKKKNSNSSIIRWIYLMCCVLLCAVDIIFSSNLCGCKEVKLVLAKELFVMFSFSLLPRQQQF